MVEQSPRLSFAKTLLHFAQQQPFLGVVRPMSFWRHSVGHFLYQLRAKRHVKFCVRPSANNQDSWFIEHSRPKFLPPHKSDLNLRNLAPQATREFLTKYALGYSSAREDEFWPPGWPRSNRKRKCSGVRSTTNNDQQK